MYCKVSGVLLVATTAQALEIRRKEFVRNMKDVRGGQRIFQYNNNTLTSPKVLCLTTHQRASSQAIANSLDCVKQEALQLRLQICEELDMVEGKCESSTLDNVRTVACNWLFC